MHLSSLAFSKDNVQLYAFLDQALKRIQFYQKRTAMPSSTGHTDYQPRQPRKPRRGR